MRRPLVLLAVLSLASLTAACGGSHEPKAGGGTGTTTGPADAQTFTIRGNDQDQYVPQTVAAKVGTLTLTLQNGGVPHNLTFQDTSLPGIGVVSGSGTKSTRLTFRTAGTFVFECTIHPGMEGKVVVSG
jgi:plastocyanin